MCDIKNLNLKYDVEIKLQYKTIDNINPRIKLNLYKYEHPKLLRDVNYFQEDSDGRFWLEYYDNLTIAKLEWCLNCMFDVVVSSYEQVRYEFCTLEVYHKNILLYTVGLDMTNIPCKHTGWVVCLLKLPTNTFSYLTVTPSLTKINYNDYITERGFNHGFAKNQEWVY